MRIDLNLFTVFETIYREGSLTRAGEQLNLTQPAISHALAKLRDQLDDPLFVRHGHKMVATPMAENLIPQVRAALAQLHQAVLSSRVFEPASSDRVFTLAMRDVLEAVLLPPLLRQLAKIAPGVRVQCVRNERKELESRMLAGEIDFALDVLVPGSENLRHEQWLHDELVVIGRKAHPALQQKLSLKRYLQAQHIQISSRSSGAGMEDIALNQQGHHRHVALRCQNHFAACTVAAQSDLLVTMPAGFAEVLVKIIPNLISTPFPVQQAAIDVHLYWHNNRDADPANIWFRQLLNQVRNQRYKES